MKRLLFLLAVAASISITSCSKCYKCSNGESICKGKSTFDDTRYQQIKDTGGTFDLGGGAITCSAE